MNLTYCYLCSTDTQPRENDALQTMREANLIKILSSSVDLCVGFEISKQRDQIRCLACSFFGVLFIFRDTLTTQELRKAEEASNTYAMGSRHIYAVLAGLFSAITGGINYCLVRAGARAFDQPLVTVFLFGLLASPATGICTFIFEDFVLPGFQSILFMLVLGFLAFLAEVLSACGLQLEKTGKVANVQYMEAALSQLWNIGSSKIAPSFGQLVGCVLILTSVSCTMYIGPDKEME